MHSNSIGSKLLACLLIICATCGLSCRRKTPQPKPSPETKETEAEADSGLFEPTTVTEAELKNIAVTVNGVETTEDQINKMLEPQLAAMAKQNQNRSPEFVEQMKKLLRQQTVEKVIIEQLIDEKAKQANITITERDINNQIKEKDCPPPGKKAKTRKKAQKNHGQDHPPLDASESQDSFYNR